MKLYCCATNWLHEIGHAPDLEKRMPLCSSIEKLKELSPCWEECGIVEIEATLVRWVEPENFNFDKPNDEEQL